MLKLFLQRFADEPKIIGDNDVDLPGEPDPDDHEPDPIDNIPQMMPSDVSNEAWKNFQEMQVTLNHYVRESVKMLSSSMDKIEKSVQKLEESMERLGTEIPEQVRSSIDDVNATMDEFKNLLEDATVEVDNPPSTEPDDLKPKHKKHTSWLDTK